MKDIRTVESCLDVGDTRFLLLNYIFRLICTFYIVQFSSIRYANAGT